MDWFHANWPYLSLIALGASEMLALTPSIKANGIVSAIINFLINYVKADAVAAANASVNPSSFADKK